MHKNEDPTASYRPVSIKAFEKVMCKQMYQYLNSYLNDQLCGFYKKYLTQCALFRSIQSWKKELF